MAAASTSSCRDGGGGGEGSERRAGAGGPGPAEGRGGKVERGGGTERAEGRRRVPGRTGGRGRGSGASMPELAFVSAPGRLPSVCRPVVAAAPRRLSHASRTRPFGAPHNRTGSPPAWVTSQFPSRMEDRSLRATGQRRGHARHRAPATLRAISSRGFLPLQLVAGSSIQSSSGRWSSKTASVVDGVECEDLDKSSPGTSPSVTTGVSPGVERPSVGSPSVRAPRGPDLQPRSLSLETNFERRRCSSLYSGQSKKTENGRCNGLAKVRFGSLTDIRGKGSENAHFINSQTLATKQNGPRKDSENNHPRDSLNGHGQHSVNGHLRNLHDSPRTSSETSRPRSLENRSSQSGDGNRSGRAAEAREARATDVSTRLLLELSLPSVMTPNCSHRQLADNSSAAIDVGCSPSGGTGRRGSGEGGEAGEGTRLLRRLLLPGSSEGPSPPAEGPVLAEDTPEEKGVRSGVAWRRRRRRWAAATSAPPVPPPR